MYVKNTFFHASSAEFSGPSLIKTPKFITYVEGDPNLKKQIIIISFPKHKINTSPNANTTTALKIIGTAELCVKCVQVSALKRSHGV